MVTLGVVLLAAVLVVGFIYKVAGGEAEESAVCEEIQNVCSSTFGKAA